MSLGYSLVKLFLKLKGEKKSWSEDPINYVKKRKQDIYKPSSFLLSGCSFKTKKIADSSVTFLEPKQLKSDFLLIYCHGGAFIYGPTRENWVALAKIASQSKICAWMVDYPKAPENKIEHITDSVFKVYTEATKSYDPSKIIVMGDSAGGSLILTLAQRLVSEGNTLPNRLIAITPVVDASVSNVDIPKVDLIDPILSLKGVRSANLMCVGELPLKTTLISPLYGEFKGLPSIHLFMATNDILTPDQELFVEKIRNSNGEIEVIRGEGMPHVWPILPFMPEAKTGLKKIISIINSAVDNE
ncbi:alpha/beta hydrolase [Aquimarina aggregata]|uniref:alpha/beta hydrolase n=1 Tax=Aquimarina aggregata TaxID=1642818 RepID=UPI00248F9647|nr:alpha/beta hydrolase [Aquimarina aggregata]